MGERAQGFNFEALFTTVLFVSRQLHGSPMLTKFIIMVNKTPRDRIASPTYSPPQKLKFMSLTRVTATDQELKEDRKT